MNNIFYIIFLSVFSFSFIANAEDDLLEDNETGFSAEEVELPAFNSQAPTEKAPSSENKTNIPTSKGLINKQDNIALESTTKILGKNDQQEKTVSYAPFDGVNAETLNIKFKSLFFTQEQIDLLYYKIKMFKNGGKNLEAIINNVKDVAEKVDSFASTDVKDESQSLPLERVFNLDTILFPKDENWTVWINNDKVRKLDADKLSDYIIKDAGENFVTIIFIAKDLNIDSPNFRNILKLQENLNAVIKITDKGASYKALDKTSTISNKALKDANFNWDYKSEDGRIWVASYDNVVKFTLKLRQKFTLSTMSISEGESSSKKADSVAPLLVAGEPSTKDASQSSAGGEVDNKPNDLDMLDPNKPIPKAVPATNALINNQPNQQQIPAPLPTMAPIR
jgi:hypothetical protein